MAVFVEELDTDSWFIKVGDVYSNPYQPTCFKITGIEIDSEDNSDGAKISGYRVDAKDYSIKIDDYEEVEKDEWFYSWYLNDYWALETI